MTDPDRPAAGRVANLVDRLSKDLSHSTKSNDVPVRRGSGKKSGKAVVRFSYNPAHEDELALNVDDVIEVIEEVEEGWMRGKVNGKMGVFPVNFVAFTPSEAPEGQRTGGKDETENTNPAAAPLAKTEDNEDAQTPEAMQREILPKKVRGIGFGDILGNANSVQLRSTKPTSTTENKTTIEFVGRKLPTAGAPAAADEQAKTADGKQKDSQLARVLFVYNPAHDDELDLPEVGALVSVLSTKCEDPGWFFGELNGKKGVFPDNFVQMLSPADAAREQKKTQSPPTVPSKPTKPPGSVSPVGNRAPSPEPTPPEKPSADLKPKAATLKYPLNGTASSVSSLSSTAKASASTEGVKEKKDEPPTDAKKSTSLSGGRPMFGPSAFAAAQSAVSQGIKLGAPAAPKAFTKPKMDESGDATSPTEPVSSQKLDHPTASRPRQPQKRPPSQVFLSHKQRLSSGDELEKTDVDSSPAAPHAKPLVTETTFPAALLPPQPKHSPTPQASAKASTGEWVSRAEYDALAKEFQSYKTETNARIAELERQVAQLHKS
uniref:SH3 domain-containing protein n=1 Tax=Plectus sambesii TaxID=2011161 RepID=A0A914VM68_9BILA